MSYVSTIEVKVLLPTRFNGRYILQRSKSPYSVCYLKQQGKSSPKLRIMQQLISSYFAVHSLIHNIIRHRVTGAKDIIDRSPESQNPSPYTMQFFFLIII